MPTPAPEPAAGALLEALRGVLCQLAEPTAVLRAILEQAVERTGAQRGLFVSVGEQGRLDFQVLHGCAPRHFEGDAGRFSRNLFARVLESGEAVVVANALEDDRASVHASVRAMRVASILCAPIRAQDRIAALVHLEQPEVGYFRPAHLESLGPLLETAGAVLETLQASRRLSDERDALRVSDEHHRREAEDARRALASEWSFGRYVGRSKAVRELENAVRKAAATDFPVLIEGETGTGKSLVARVLHSAGPRASGPFVTLFCPSLERGMVEAELFGHKRGAFTGAQSDRAGKVQAAENGTLFLDEIAELPLELQPKLLRLLQERTYERVGDTAELRSNARIVAASNRDLEQEIRAGRFRRDLYERLNFLPVRTPPLRERTDDIPLLLRHCLDLSEAGRWVELAPAAEQYLRELPFAWPGNVRHVEQLAARLTAEGERGPVGPGTVARLLGATVRTDDASAASAGMDLERGLPSLLEEAEKAWLGEALRRYPDLTRAALADKLRISESALYKKLREHGLGG